jgi:hypothetical protein
MIPPPIFMLWPLINTESSVIVPILPMIILFPFLYTASIYLIRRFMKDYMNEFSKLDWAFLIFVSTAIAMLVDFIIMLTYIFIKG